MTNDQTTGGSLESWIEESHSYPSHQALVSALHEGDGQAPEPVFDLQERTAKFGEAIIRFAKQLPQNSVNNRLIDQLVGCGTSIGANYAEADDAVSKKDFLHKIGTCRKEAKETKFFLRMVASAEPALADEARKLWREARELHLIFCAILRKGRSNDQ